MTMWPVTGKMHTSLTVLTPCTQGWLAESSDMQEIIEIHLKILMQVEFMKVTCTVHESLCLLCAVNN